MADEETSYAIDLPIIGEEGLEKAAKALDALAVRLATQKDVYSAAEKSANQAAKAIERLGVSAEAQKTKLATAKDLGDTKGAEKAEKTLAALANRQAEAVDKSAKLKAAFVAEASALDKVQGDYDKLSTAKKAAEKAGKEGGEGEEPHLAQISRGLGKIGGPLAEAGRKVVELKEGFSKLGESLGTVGLIVGATVAVVALTAAFVAGVVAIAHFAVGLADTNRTLGLLSAGIARSVAGGAALDDKITALTRTLPLTREELQSTASNLANAGLRGDALTAALTRTATAAAKLKFGPEFAKQMLSLDEQSKVFHENIADLFGGLHIDGLLEGLQKLIALFDSSTASGKAIKVVFESIFQPVIDSAAGATTKIEAFFLRFEILALKLLIAIKPHASIILKMGEAIGIVAGLAVALAAGFGLVALAVALATSPIFLIGLAITGAVFAILVYKDKILAAFSAVKAWLQSFSLADVATALIEGLANGITGGGLNVLKAAIGVVTGAVDGVKKFLGIASPSKVFADIGTQTGAGMAQGVDKAAGDVQNSLVQMVAPPTPRQGSATPAAPAAAPSKGSGGGANFGGAVFNFYGVEGAEDAESRIGALLTRLVEGDVTALGASVPA